MNALLELSFLAFKFIHGLGQRGHRSGWFLGNFTLAGTRSKSLVYFETDPVKAEQAFALLEQAGLLCHTDVDAALALLKTEPLPEQPAPA